MLSPTLIAIIIAVAILDTLAQFLVRIYYEHKTGKFYLVFLAWLMYLGTVFSLVLAYDYSKLAIANAVWDSITIIALALIGYFYFGEPLGTGEIVGIGLVIAGAITIGLTTKEKDEVI